MRPEQLTEMRDGGQRRGGDRLSSEVALLMGSALQKENRFDRASQANNDRLGLPGLIISGCENGGPGCEARGGFKPAPRDSAQGRAWQKLDEQQRGKPVEIGPDGTYQVKRGDSLSRIAERSLQGEGNKQPSKAEIQNQMKRIMEANPVLKCNPDYLKEGEKLKIPGNKNEKPVPAESPARKPTDITLLPNPPIVKPEPRLTDRCPPERKPNSSTSSDLRIVLQETPSMSSELSGVIGYEQVPHPDNKVKR